MQRHNIEPEETFVSAAFSVDAERMKVFSLLTNDPNPIHWDHSAPGVVAAGGRLVNQGGLNVAYIHNAVLQWAGVGWMITHTRVRFSANAFEGDRVTVSGSVVEAPDMDNGTVRVDVRLQRERDGVELVSGFVELRSNAC